jgi:hypothetical protein
MSGKILEARVGIEPTHKGFADLSLTTWVPRPGTEEIRVVSLRLSSLAKARGKSKEVQLLERETGFEPATSTLARSHSTTELLPLRKDWLDYIVVKMQGSIKALPVPCS